MKLLVLELVGLARFRAGGSTVFVEVESAAVDGHPADGLRWDTGDQGVVRHVRSDHCTGRDKAMPTQGHAAPNGGICSHGGALLDQGGLVFASSVDGAARVSHVGEHARRPEERVILDGDALVEADVVLDFDVGTQCDAARNKRVLAQAGPLSQDSFRHHVAKMPNLRILVQHRALVHDRRRMHEG